MVVSGGSLKFVDLANIAVETICLFFRLLKTNRLFISYAFKSAEGNRNLAYMSRFFTVL